MEQDYHFDINTVADICTYVREWVAREGLVDKAIKEGGDYWHGFKFNGYQFDLNLFNFSIFDDGLDKWYFSVYFINDNGEIEMRDQRYHIIEGVPL